VQTRERPVLESAGGPRFPHMVFRWPRIKYLRVPPGSRFSRPRGLFLLGKSFRLSKLHLLHAPTVHPASGVAALQTPRHASAAELTVASCCDCEHTRQVIDDGFPGSRKARGPGHPPMALARKNSRSNGSPRKQTKGEAFVLCVRNEGYPASLERR